MNGADDAPCGTRKKRWDLRAGFAFNYPQTRAQEKRLPLTA